MLVKAKVLETIQSLPDNFSLDELVERLIVLEKIQEGLRQVEDGEVMSNEKAKKRLGKWLK
jgi:predicted transcriptional regulator